MYEIISEAFVIACLLSVAGLAIWAIFAIAAALDRSQHAGARYEPDPRALRRLQAKRRLALRHLGSRWVLHPNQPSVKWGHGRG